MRQPERPRAGTTIAGSRWAHGPRRSFPWRAGGQSPVAMLKPDESGRPGNLVDERIVAAASRNRCLALGVCVLLLLAVGLVFGQTIRHGFVNYDDNTYIYANARVARGLSIQGIVWAFHSHCGNWHPLTWVSLMLDCQLYGLSAGGHHITNVLLHAAAYAEAGRFPEALAAARRALELATRQNDLAFADTLRTRIALYEAGRPFHQRPSASALPRPEP